MLTQRTHPVTWPTGLSIWGDAVAPKREAGAFYNIAKRWLDLVFAVTSLILLAPLMALIGLAIKLDSPGPIIYVQRRVGLGGRVFDFYKFRSMTNGHDHTQDHRKFVEAYINGHTPETQQSEDGQAIYKPASNGHTVTRVGRWLRRTSLDELPQLLNILKGDMSLVGPRPAMDYEVALYSERHRQRLAVLPGLTGWAAINGRSSLSFEQIVSLDLEYIAARSLRHDLGIILATVPIVLRAEAAG